MKTFLNNKKIPCILSIFYENDFVIDFQKRVEIFNEFSAKQCTVVRNSSKVPSVFIRKTQKHLSTVTFYENQIKKTIRNLDPNKTHGHGMFCIHMLKICDDSLCGPLGLIFQSCFENGKFPSEWKKTNVVCTHKKNDNESKTIIQSRYFQFVVRSLNTLFIMNHFISFKETTLSH